MKSVTFNQGKVKQGRIRCDVLRVQAGAPVAIKGISGCAVGRFKHQRLQNRKTVSEKVCLFSHF